MLRLPWLSSLVVLLSAGLGCGGCGKASPAGPGETQPGAPVETRSPEGKGQTPAFPGQTRAPFTTAGVAFDVRVVASKLEHPWSLAFLPDGSLLVTERPGRMRILDGKGAVSPPVAGVPPVYAQGQGGLFDVALGPSFATDGVLYVSYAEARDGGNGTAVARARLVRDAAPRLEDVQVIWRVMPTLASDLHFGGRIVLADEATMYVTTGERAVLEGRRQAQDLASDFGKIVRIRTDGSAPPGNPFLGRPGALPEIFSRGHRNVQGAALHPTTGKLWIVDHGARGGDEVNVIEAGKDYGWPTITYGVEYAGGPVGDGLTQKEGMEQPRYYWDPSIAPSGMAFYRGAMFPAWEGSLFVGALAGRHLVRLTLEGEKIVGEERLLVDRARIRDVRVGPDGALYVVTDEGEGEVLALVPSQSR